MNVLTVTSTARGHAIVDSLSRSPQKPTITAICTAANPGIRTLATSLRVLDIMDFDAVLAVAKKSKPDFAIIGPDDPIGAGLADLLQQHGIPCIAPTKSCARIESSKGFTRELLRKYSIDASPKFSVFTRADRKKLNNFIAQELGGNFVVKYDGLKGGKGVKVSGEHLQSNEEGVDYAIECIEECGRVVIEEKLIGVEFSLISFVSGTQVVHTPAIQDHKRAYEGDTGPNTGGMGTYSDSNHSLPFLEDSDIKSAQEINVLTAEALQEECGEPFRGFLYGGFIAVKDGVRLIEYNARLGDPEALNLLPLLTSDFVAVCQAMIDGKLTEGLVQFEKKATVCKYITPDCYPERKDRKGEPIRLPRPIEGSRIFYGDISEDTDSTLHLGGSRTAGIVGIAETITEAERIVQSLCEKVEGSIRYRRDIGTADLIAKRSAMMHALRS